MKRSKVETRGAILSVLLALVHDAGGKTTTGSLRAPVDEIEAILNRAVAKAVRRARGKTVGYVAMDLNCRGVSDWLDYRPRTQPNLPSVGRVVLDPPKRRKR